MTNYSEINRWLYQRVVEIEDRYPAPDEDPKAEDVRQLAKSLRFLLQGVQEIAPMNPNVAEVLVKHAAKAFVGYDGYQEDWS